MPTFKTGEMFRARGFIIVTTNSFLTSEVKLVMGRGAALQLRMKVPGIDRTGKRSMRLRSSGLLRFDLP
jgi:hypothetical protein